jgi:hypothetical protein
MDPVDVAGPKQADVWFGDSHTPHGNKLIPPSPNRPIWAVLNPFALMKQPGRLLLIIRSTFKSNIRLVRNGIASKPSREQSLIRQAPNPRVALMLEISSEPCIKLSLY